MATTAQSNMTNPSDYVAHHLQNFATSSHQPSWSTHGHPATGFPNPYALLLPIALFVVLTSIAAFNDRWAVFRLAVPMSLRRRLSVWWSCAWRQRLVSLFLAKVVSAGNVVSIAEHVVSRLRSRMPEYSRPTLIVPSHIKAREYRSTDAATSFGVQFHKPPTPRPHAMTGWS